MLPELNTIHRILFIDLKPQDFKEKPEAWWLSKKTKTPVQKHTFPINAEVVFINDPNPMLAFYRQIIDNDFADFYNKTNLLIESMGKPEEKRYLANSILQKTLHDKLNEVSEIIKRKKYHLEILLPGKTHEDHPLFFIRETYVFQYIKFGMIVLFQNIQDQFSDYMETPLSAEDIFRLYFREEKPDFSYRQDAPEYKAPIKPIVIDEILVPRDYEVNPHHKLLMTPENIKKKIAFERIEKKMIEYGLIDKDYHFISNKGQGNTQLLAAVYKKLIHKDYFRLHILGSKKKLQELDIRKFLDELYQVDTSQQFRRMNDDVLNNASIKLPWLENI